MIFLIYLHGCGLSTRENDLTLKVCGHLRNMDIVNYKVNIVKYLNYMISWWADA